jgi:hypothetical protein
VRAREERLTEQVTHLQIQIDAAKRAKEVAAVTETGFFQDLLARAEQARARHKQDASDPDDSS